MEIKIPNFSLVVLIGVSGSGKSRFAQQIVKLSTAEKINSVSIERVPLWNDKTELTGPFDIIGDVHGCYDELVQLLLDLGYRPTLENKTRPMQGPIYSHPQGRMAIFLGDIVDRGPKIIDSLRLVYNMVNAGYAGTRFR